MKFPTMVYICPGAHFASTGTYDYRGIDDQAQLDAALAAGWSLTLPEAVEKKYGVPAVSTVATSAQFKAELEVLGDNDPPTRAELEQQATELGIKFKKNTTDEELAKKIDEALEG